MLKQAARRSFKFFYVDVGFRNTYFCAVVTATVALSKDHCILHPLNAIPSEGAFQVDNVKALAPGGLVCTAARNIRRGVPLNLVEFG